MNVATSVLEQPAADSPPMEEALRESLARAFNVPASVVESIYREELRKLVADARINTYLGVLATRSARVRLVGRKYGGDGHRPRQRSVLGT